VSAPLFIPFLGAMITMREMPQDAWNEAKVAIAGPLVGSAGAALFWLAGALTDSNHLTALAFLGFLINLFNLLPIVPLDGGRIVAALHPGLWLVGFAGLLGLVILSPNPLLIIILVLSGLELWQRWQTRNHPELQAYYRVLPSQRAIIAILYFGLAILLVLGMEATHLPRDVLR
jgi:Zn-dependent protease